MANGSIKSLTGVFMGDFAETGRNNKVVVVSGTTASGKTKLGILLAQSFGGEVISADSMQVYRGMDIGTAKPSIEEREGIPHHMLDVADPSEEYSVARYVEEASGCAEEILGRGKLPIVVGGTGLYIDALVAGRTFAAPRDEALREELNQRYDRLGGEAMLVELERVDPERAAVLHPADRKRIVRALETFMLTGETITKHDEISKGLPPRYSAAHISLSCADRGRLYERIDDRVDEMMEKGLLSEVDGLLRRDTPIGSSAAQAIGYKELIRHLEGEVSLDEAVALIKMESRRYAKRQLTWFSRNKDAKWIMWGDEVDFDFARRFSTEILLNFGIRC